MSDVTIQNVTGFAGGMDLAGGIFTDPIGKGSLLLSSDSVKFNELRIPYKEVNAGKLTLDRMLMLHSFQLELIASEKLFIFQFRAKPTQVEGLPISWVRETRKRVLANVLLAWMGLSFLAPIGVFIYKAI